MFTQTLFRKLMSAKMYPLSKVAGGFAQGNTASVREDLRREGPRTSNMVQNAPETYDR